LGVVRKRGGGDCWKKKGETVFHNTAGGGKKKFWPFKNGNLLDGLRGGKHHPCKEKESSLRWGLKRAGKGEKAFQQKTKKKKKPVIEKNGPALPVRGKPSVEWGGEGGGRREAAVGAKGPGKKKRTP